MKTNSLKFNDSKTEVIVFGSAQRLKKLKLQALHVGNCLVRVIHSIRNLGVQFDAEMTIELHVTAVCQQYSTSTTSRRSEGIVQQQRQSKSYMHLLQADSMLAMLYRLPLKQIRRLQKVQNWAARLIDVTIKYSSSTPLLMKLHWLLIAVRVESCSEWPCTWIP